MTSLNFETHVDSLPKEVLLLVFDRLDLKTVKSASLACRKWHDIIFLSTYAKRFKFILPFQNSNGHSTKEVERAVMCQLRMNEVIGALKQTQRYYRNLRLIVQSYMINSFPPLWESLHPKVTENIYSLDIDFQMTPSRSIVQLLAKALPTMPNLQSLSLYHWSPADDPIVLKSCTVKYLKMGADAGYAGVTIEMPELQSFQGPLCSLGHPKDIAQPQVFAKLIHVTLTNNAEKLNDTSIIHRLVHVKTLKLMFHIENQSLLMAICDTCSSLKELYFGYGLPISVLATTCGRFISLGQLQFGNARMKGPLGFAFNFDLSKVSQLEHLHLGYTVLRTHGSVCLPKSIRTLTVSITAENEGTVIQTISRSLTQLQTLQLVYLEGTDSKANVAVAEGTLKSLHLLKQLEVLVFINAKFNKSVFLHVDTPMHVLRKLQFVNCNLSPNDLDGLQKIFPNLKHLEFPSALPWWKI